MFSNLSNLFNKSKEVQEVITKHDITTKQELTIILDNTLNPNELPELITLQDKLHLDFNDSENYYSEYEYTKRLLKK